MCFSFLIMLSCSIQVMYIFGYVILLCSFFILLSLSLSLSLYMLFISCYVDLTLWYNVLLLSCLASLSYPSVALCSYSQFAVDILPVWMLNGIKDFVCYPAYYFGRLPFSLVKRQTRWRHYLRDVIFPTFYHQNLKIPQFSQFQHDRLSLLLHRAFCRIPLIITPTNALT